jgi:glycosyltransferase involved in cell wall biosynthesis
MKLLYLHSGEIGSGKANATQVLHMCSAFARLGVDVTLALPGSNADIVRENIISQIGKEPQFKVKTFRKTTVCGRMSMVGGYLGINKLLKSAKTDFCFARNFVFLNAPLSQNIPAVFEAHNSFIHHNHFLNAIWMRNFIRNCGHPKLIKFIGISNALTDFWIKAGVPERKALALHDAVDVQQYAVVEDQVSMREILGLPKEKKIVIYTGSLYKDRGIESIHELAKIFQEVLFVVVGGPKDRKDLYLRISKDLGLSNMLFTGYVSHYKVKQYLFAADVLLMIWSRKVPTINYCSPLKTFEYMAAERIIVGHAFPTILEVLKDGEHAYLANPDSFDDLHEKMTLALNEEYPSPMAIRARALVMKEYTWEARARSILFPLSHLPNYDFL